MTIVRRTADGAVEVIAASEDAVEAPAASRPVGTVPGHEYPSEP